MSASAPLVVSIGMTHPQNVAGLGIDVRVAADYGVRHAMVVAAISAQTEDGVQSVFPVPASVVVEQLQAVRLENAAAIRVGALGNAANVELVAAAARDLVTVIDPVLRSSAGGSLYVDDPRAALLAALDANVILTPNVDEAQRLTGLQVATVEQMIAAGNELLTLGARAALVKGGHLAGEPVDVLVSGGDVQTFADTRLPGRLRGTGCRLAMALACELALGRGLAHAVKGARAYVRENLARS